MTLPSVSSRRSARPLRWVGLALVVAFVVSACLGGESGPTPAATPAQTAASQTDDASATATPTLPDRGTPAPVDGGAGPGDTPAPTAVGVAIPGVTPVPRARNTLVVVAPEPPTRLLPPATNAAERLLIDLLYEPLYRLNEEFTPVPALARELPEISADGMTWKIPLRINSRFHDGKTVSPEDVKFTLLLARTPTCSFGRDLCDAVADHVDEVVVNNRSVEIKLNAPHAPFLADALARLPILSEKAVERATSKLRRAADLGDDRPDKVILEIREDLFREVCAEPEKPDGCLLTDHRKRIERIMGLANLDLPSQTPYTDDTGIFDEDGYTTELLDRLGQLAQVLTTDGRNRDAAALPLLDITDNPLGGGPFELQRINSNGVHILAANPDRAGGEPSVKRVELHVERNASEAVTRLLAGEADWILEIGGELAPVVIDAPGVIAAPRPLMTQRGILFNVRSDRVYFDFDARRAFAACLDREALATQLDAERAVATTPFAAGTWATPEAEPWPYDPAAGNLLLDEGGWEMGIDGVRVKDGVRLSTTMAVRPSRVDVFTFANAAAQQLSECGIELTIEELDLTGDTMLTQLQWPNDFDTLLLARRLGVDPNAAVRMFETSRITDETNQADANPSGFTSEVADFHVDNARATIDETERAADYAGIQALLDDNIPYWPLWYDTSIAALSDRVSGADGPIDPSRTRYAWDVANWKLDG
jgi:ABC-type transport system substrate-binding protein